MRNKASDNYSDAGGTLRLIKQTNKWAGFSGVR